MYINGPGLMTKNGRHTHKRPKNLKRFSGTRSPMIMKIGMHHRELGVYEVYANDDPGHFCVFLFFSCFFFLFFAIYDLVHDVETIFKLYLLLTASGSLFSNICDAPGNSKLQFPGMTHISEKIFRCC